MLALAWTRVKEGFSLAWTKVKESMLALAWTRVKEGFSQGHIVIVLLTGEHGGL